MNNNCIVINLNLILKNPCDPLSYLCIPHEGAPSIKSIDDLKGDLGRLKGARDDIEIDIRKSHQMLPTEKINVWCHQVATLDVKFRKLEIKWNKLRQITGNTQESENNSIEIPETGNTQESEQVNQNGICFCSKCIKTYCLMRKIQLMDQKVLKLLQQIPVDILQTPCPSPAQRLPVELTVGMEPMFDDVWSHVQNQCEHHVRLIGLYGMGVVGKTALLKAVNNKLCDSRLNFDLHLWIVVSKTPNLVDIQNQIGEKIGFNGDDWRVKSQDEKATAICNAIYQKKYKYVLLLDDLWERIDLVKIGIPLPNMTNKSMVIFTTRSLQVCGQMGATPIQIQCLNDNKAWDLFNKIVGETTFKGRPDVQSLARDVMKRCGGLPSALTIIGRAMAFKTTVHDWKYAIQVLQRCADFSTIKEEVFIPLKHSYDKLANDDIRSCLLYCSSYGEHQEILISDLVDNWIQAGLLGTTDDRPSAVNKGYRFLNTLVDANLLEKCSLEEENVKMHNMIRDMVLWIIETSPQRRAH